MHCETSLDTLPVVFPLSLSQPGKVENWLQVVWRRSYLVLTVEWHHNGAAGVQLPFRPPPSVLPSAFTSAFADKLRLMTEISRGTCLPSNITVTLSVIDLMSTAKYCSSRGWTVLCLLFPNKNNCVCHKHTAVLMGPAWLHSPLTRQIKYILNIRQQCKGTPAESEHITVSSTLK